MSNIFNPDFVEFIQCLNNSEVQYILIGGYSVILHGYSRTTGDLDVWVKRDKENYARLLNAFEEFQMPVFDMTEQNFLYNLSIDVFTFGRPPVAIDVMLDVKGLVFDKCYENAGVYDLDGLPIKFLHLNDLIRAKRASGRAKDQDDIEHLER